MKITHDEEREQSGIPPSDLSGRRPSSWSIPFAPSEGMTIEFRGSNQGQQTNLGLAYEAPFEEMEQSGIPPGDLSARRRSSWSVLFAPSKEMTTEFRGLLIAISSCSMIALIFNLGKPWDWHYGEKVAIPFGGRTTLMFMIIASWVLVFGTSYFLSIYAALHLKILRYPIMVGLTMGFVYGLFGLLDEVTSYQIVFGSSNYEINGIWLFFGCFILNWCFWSILFVVIYRRLR